MNQYLADKTEDFNKSEDFFRKDIATLRTGRANPAILDNVSVDAYGTKSALNALANINVADQGGMVIAPWDKSLLKAIEKGIVDANLGLAVVNEGDKLRLKMPALTEENRRELVKKLNEKYEKARVEVRTTREAIKAGIEKAFADKAIGEDDKFRFIKELDEAVAQRNDGLKAIRDAKEKDIMTI